MALAQRCSRTPSAEHWRRQILGIRALAGHAKDLRAEGFYAHFGFRPSPSDPLHLFVLLKDLQGMTGK